MRFEVYMQVGFSSYHIQLPCTYPQGDLHDLMERKGKLDAGTAIRFALDIARFFLKYHLPLHLSVVSEWLSLHYLLIIGVKYGQISSGRRAVGLLIKAASSFCRLWAN